MRLGLKLGFVIVININLNTMEKLISIEASVKAEGQWILTTVEHNIYVFGSQLNKALGANLELVLRILLQKQDYLAMLSLLENSEVEVSVVEAAGTEYISANGEICSRKEDKLGITKILMPNFNTVLADIISKK